jgi:hypothetical protein
MYASFHASHENTAASMINTSSATCSHTSVSTVCASTAVSSVCPRTYVLQCKCESWNLVASSTRADLLFDKFTAAIHTLQWSEALCKHSQNVHQPGAAAHSNHSALLNVSSSKLKDVQQDGRCDIKRVWLNGTSLPS